MDRDDQNRFGMDRGRLIDITKSRDNNAMHAKSGLRVVLKMEDLPSGLGDRGRYHASLPQLPATLFETKHD